MLSISAIGHPSWDDLVHSVAQKLSGSLDCKVAKTECSRTVHFLKFVEIYELGDKFLTNDKDVTTSIMERCVSFLLDGYTLQHISIAVNTIVGYMRAVNTYYKKRRFKNQPFDKKLEANAAKFLGEQAKFKDKPEQREPLNDKILVHMMELSSAGHRFGFRQAIWLWRPWLITVVIADKYL